MNMERLKISIFWLSFFVFCLLLWHLWRERLLWMAIVVPAWIVIGLVKPRLPWPSRKLGLLFQVGLVLMLAAVLVHTFYPASQAAFGMAQFGRY